MRPPQLDTLFRSKETKANSDPNSRNDSRNPSIHAKPLKRWAGAGSNGRTCSFLIHQLDHGLGFRVLLGFKSKIRVWGDTSFRVSPARNVKLVTNGLAWQCCIEKPEYWLQRCRQLDEPGHYPKPKTLSPKNFSAI